MEWYIDAKTTATTKTTTAAAAATISQQQQVNNEFVRPQIFLPVLSFHWGSFLFNWLDLLAFSLSGLKAEGTSCAAMAYVMADLHREGAKLGEDGSANK